MELYCWLAAQSSTSQIREWSIKISTDSSQLARDLIPSSASQIPFLQEMTHPTSFPATFDDCCCWLYNVTQAQMKEAD